MCKATRITPLSCHVPRSSHGPRKENDPAEVALAQCRIIRTAFRTDVPGKPRRGDRPAARGAAGLCERPGVGSGERAAALTFMTIVYFDSGASVKLVVEEYGVAPFLRNVYD